METEQEESGMELLMFFLQAITANFINRNTPDEHNVPEISGVARIYNQQFFKDLCSTAGIDLENIVYYKDTTHYFVMTAKKSSLLAKGVLKEVNITVGVHFERTPSQQNCRVFIVDLPHKFGFFSSCQVFFFSFTSKLFRCFCCFILLFFSIPFNVLFFSMQTVLLEFFELS